MHDTIRTAQRKSLNSWELGLAEPLLKFLKDPAAGQPVQNIYEIYSKDEAAQEAVSAFLLADQGFKRLYESWYEIEPFTLDDLIALPTDSFGFVYATHMIKNGLNPNFIDKFPTKDVLSYLWLRAGHVHDITHVLTGFDTSFSGELAVKGFELAQYRSPATATVLGGGFLSIASMSPLSLGDVFEKIVEGYQLGKSWPLLAGVQWDEEWKTPIEDLKSKLGIEGWSL
jgi:ubiquinone biosynthesis protein COQ4